MLDNANASYEDLTVVIPAFNEAEGIGLTLQGLQRAVAGAEIIVVDDHSRDRTGMVASDFPQTRVVRHSFNRGQGASLKTGMRLATRPYVAWFDADNQHRVSDLQQLYQRLKSDDLVAVIGQRTSGSSSVARGVGKAVIRLIGRSLKIRAGSDLNCGLRVFRRDLILGYLPLVPDRFSASLVSTLILLERGYPIAFEPVETNDRVGNSTVRLRDGFDAVLQLIRAILLFAPMRFFLPLGLGSFALGTVYSLGIAWIRGSGLPVGGMFLMTLGVLVVMLGLLADQISQLRLSRLSELVAHVEQRPEEIAS
jgi:glycosyltransferase involved in cell wall biosynthesis